MISNYEGLPLLIAAYRDKCGFLSFEMYGRR